MKDSINHSSTTVQETLFQKYYTVEEFSDVTSSHWRKFGKETEVTRVKNGYEFKAQGISQYRIKTSLGAVKHLPIDYLLFQMLSKYRAEKQTIKGAKSGSGLRVELGKMGL